MKSDQIVAMLSRQNLSLAIDGEELVVRGEKHRLDAALIELLQQNKTELLEFLRDGANASRLGWADGVPENRIPADCSAITPDMLPLVALSAAEIAGIVAAVPGGAANVQDVYPLAPLQEGILFHHLLSGEGDPYLACETYWFDDRDRLDAYVAALQSVIDRHDALRTAILWEGLSEPVQVVLRSAPLIVEEVTDAPADGDRAEHLAARFSPRHYRLDLRRAPLLRAVVAREAHGERWAMVLLEHHIWGDNTSVHLLRGEVEAHLLGRAGELPAPTPFRNFISHARFGVSREEHELFFREMLEDVDEPTAPFGLVDVQRDGSRIREASEVIDAALAERLRSAARSIGVSTASLWHVAWARVLARVSGRDDVVFGTVLFGRMEGEGADRALGMFTNTLPVRLRIGESGVRESVEHTQLLLAQLLRHEHAPLTLAQACSAVPASTPLFSSLLNYRHGSAQSAQVAGAWKGVSVQGGEERTNYPIGVSVNDTGDALSLSVKSDASVDPERLCGYLRMALAGVADALERDPARALASVEVVPERERAQVLVEWNATEVPYPADFCVHELFEQQAARSPEPAALEFDGERLSYGELNARANRLARHLQALGVEAGTRVGVLMERSLEFAVGVLGVLKAGGVYVPLDPAYPEERLAFMLADAAPPVVLTHARVAGDRAELLRQSPCVVDVVADADVWSAESASNLPGAADASDLAYVIYTSGSTGAPKGVMVSHEQLCSRLLGAQLDLCFGAGDVLTNLASPAFDIALFELLVPLVSGGCSLLLGSAQVKDIEQLRARTQHATVFHAVPTLMEAWLDSLGASEYGSLHTILVGGEAVPERLLLKLTARFPQARVFEFYGPTEAVIISTRYRADGAALTGVAHCIGRPFANTRTYILDERLHPVPIGVGGELYIGGAQIACGYLNRADLTAERFIASPFVDGDRLYKTGDLARYLPDGNIEFLGRNDFQVKIRGFRIELGEIEARLWSYPGVREAAVVALEDRTGEKRLVAYYTALDPLGAEELRSHVAATLPEYMIPAAYVQLDVLPLTSHGKLDRRALPAPDDSAYASRAYEAPVGEIELSLAAVWREMLGVERVGRNDNFFELGGHSLLVVAALERLRQVGLHVDAAAFFGSATLSALASEVQEESLQVVIPPNAIPADCTAITPAMLPLVALNAAEIAAVVATVPGGAANVQDVYPLAPLQEGVLFHHLLGGEGDPYLSRTVYRFDSRERLEAYLQALESVIARHDVLRTAVLWEGLPEPVQVVLRRAPLTVEELTVDPSAGDVGEQLATRFNPRHFRLDVRRAPIMRAYIARDGVAGGHSDGWSMVLLKHHLLGDHTAMELMQHEVEAYLLGRADALPAPVPFRNFIAQARLGVSREEHELFFREMLADVDEPTAPFGLVDVHRDGSTTRQTLESVDAALAERLRNVARAIGVSTASLCHVAWARVLASVSGRDDVVFGTLMFGRMQGAGSDRALGMFMNTLPVRLRIDGRGVRESVEQTQLLLAQLLRHEHAPLALAQRCSAVPGSLPLFTSLLNYRHDDSSITGDAWEGITVEEAEERTNYPIGMSVNDHGGGALSLSVKSDVSVDPARLCSYMQTALAGVVEALEREPARSLASVEVVPEHERRQVLVEWNATEHAFGSARCVHELFEEQAARSPESVALEFEGERLSYGELNARANRLARHLQALGVQGETRVGVLMERSLEFAVGVLGVLKAGGVYVPLDPAYPSERLAFMLADASPPVVLTHERVAEDRAELLRQSPVQVVDVVADADGWSAESASNLDTAAASDLAYVIYTSGSTGAPKGVMVSHEQLCSRLLGAQLDLGFGAGDVLTNVASPAFDIALFELLMPLVSGGCSLLLGSGQVKDIEQLRARTQHATVFHAVPTLMEAWLDSLGATEYGSLHTILVGGEAVPERLLGKLAARFPQARVFEFYGPTEAVIISTRYRSDGAAPAGAAHCIGRPFANTRAYILDARLVPVPIGVGGELYIGGAQIARGYLNRADLTAERFIASPFVDGDRLYKTGDLARYLADGNIEFLGRNDFQVKIRGFRIELGEIEARLWSYPGVREAAVVALEDRAGEKRLVAYYTTLGAPSALGAEELRSHVAATLPEYMIPAAYVQLDVLPLTAHGKLDRRALPAPDDSAYVSRAYEAPAGDVELTLAAIWRELLAVERVGRNDNFFELGGHSLLVVAALERLRQVGLHVDAAAFFGSATLSALAAEVRDESLDVAIPPNAIPADCTTITPDMLPLVQLNATEIAGIVAAVPGGAANVQDIYPLAPLQEGILFHHLLGGEGDPYLSRTGYRFESRERLDAYLQALEAVIARHDVLRTAVAWEGLPEPVQVVLRRAPLAVEEVTADPSAGDVVEQLAARFNPRHFRLDVRQAPIMRAYVARDGAGGAWSMVLLKHHLLGDHTAMDLMQHEVETHLLGRADELPASVPFRNFIAQARLGVSREEHEQFFREMLSDVDEPTAPFGLVDVHRDGSTTRQTYEVVDAVLAERLRSVARAVGVSTASICHVAWARVLARVSGRDDVVFGTLLFGRMQGEGSGRALGMFMNTLPVRLRIGDRGVRESVEHAQLLLAQLLRHEHAPLALAQRCSAVPGSTPLFSSLLNYRHGASKNAASSDVEQAWRGIAVLSGEERTNYPIGMSVNDHGDELSLSVKSDASVDPDRLCGYMQTALAGMVDALEREPARALSSVEVVPERERAQVLVEWNATEAAYAGVVCVQELFEEQVWHAPESLALEFGGERLSYGELNERANRLARHLQALGVQAQTRVGVLMERSPEFAVGVLGVLKAGGVYVPLDPAYPQERLAFMLADAAPPVVLTHERVAEDRAELLRQSPVRVVDVVADADVWSAEAASDLQGAAAPSDLAYVIYTSGSTGAPKGVMVSHEQLCSRLLGAQLDLGFGPGDVLTNLASPAFDIALFELLMPLVSGGCSLLLGSGQVKDIEQLRARTQHATVFHAVPTLMEAWLDSLEATEYGSLHTVLVGGEAVPERLLGKLTARFPQARVFEFYGPTEAVIISTRYRADGAALEGVAHCIGRPFANTRTYILDERLQPAPIGVGGELYIGGAQVARGYLNRADLTAERFIASPFVDGDRLYKTGDLARYLPDGNIEFLGRNDFQVKIRGFRIELGEIEARLWSYPGVREAAVVALEDRAGEKRLVAYYTAFDALGAPGAEELRSHVAATLPEYMIPAAYVQLDVLPLTAHGKLDRRALPAPDDNAYVSRAYEAPAGEIELTLAAVWRELLNVERVGRNDNFFELGGHSLLVVAALERLRQVGLHVDAAAFFGSATLSALASAVRDESMEVAIPPNEIPGDCTAITPAMLPLVALNAAEIAGIVAAVPGGAANVQDIYPLAPLQEGILFHHILGGDGDPYLGRSTYRFESRERLDAYLAALEAVIVRHDVLRTSVVWEGLPEPVQVVLRHAPMTVEEVSADPSAGDVAEQLADRFNPRHFRLDVRQAPIMSAYIARDGVGDGWAMALLKHHLLGDHTAMEVMQHEVETHLLGRADELQAPVPFRNFIAQARLGISREEHEQFFRDMLSDVDEPTAPFGLVDVRRDGSTTRQTYEVVDTVLAERLRSVARSVGVSTASICHVAWARVLARVSGRDDVVFGTLMFGRMQGAGSDRALGMFMNTLPVRLRIDGRGVRESVEHTQLLLAQLLRHEHAPLTLAQACSAVPASTPLFSSLLNYRHGKPRKKDEDEAWKGFASRGGEERTNYPIGMSVNDHGDELSLSVKSDASVDPDRLCGYMQTALAAVVDALENEPARALTSVEVIPERERRQVLVTWNATERPYPAASICVHELFEEQASRAPESAALEFDGERLSYGELNARANRLARHLQGLGVQAQTRVGVLMERSLEFAVGVLGVLKAGGVYVPLDPAYPEERLAFMLSDAAPPVVLTHERVSGDRAELLRQSPARVVDVVADADVWSAESASNLPGAAAASDLAYVIYTSGSTGAPKGVMVSHQQLCSRLLGVQRDLGFGPGDVLTNLASPAFDIALFELLMPLVNGGRSLLLGGTQVKDIEQLRARTQHATVFHAVPTLMEAWLDSLGASEYGSLHTILVGGEAVPERLLLKLTARFPRARVFEFYGPTETVIISTRYRADGAGPAGVAHCIGRPFANTRTYILDARLEPAPIGVGGELFIGGAHVARGYLNRAELTAERFIASPFVDGDRLYKTGDLARYLPDGNIEFLGRNDFQVKIRGFRIELGEIEARLWSYPGVREAAVVALEDRAGEKRLVAYYTALDTLGAEELRSYVAAALPEYMIPAAYVQLDALPLTPHGKLDRRALPAPDDSAYASRAYEAPVGDVELTLAAVWRDLLKVERVGRNDNFFELGGHSLLVVAALERLRQVGLHVDAAAFFASGTLSALANEARDESSEVAIPPNAIPADCTAITPDMLPLVALNAAEIDTIVAAVPGGAANVQDIYPLAPLQGGILFHHILGGDGDPYLGRSTYRFESRERLDAYLQALEGVIARHDVLRTAMVWERLPEPLQVVLRRAPLTVEEVSVDPSAGDVAEQLADRFNPRHFRLDVRQAPIMRAYIARDGDGDGWSMVLLKHHLLGDHTAMELMQHEIEAHLLGRIDELPAPAPFRNFIAQARLGVSREEHEQFFGEMLADVDEPTAPFGLVDVRRDGSTTRQTYEVIDGALAERLRNAARSIGVSTASICHVAWARVLARVSGRDDVVFGTLLFGRMQGEGSDRALGMFMNTLPVRLRIDDRTVRESIEQTQLLLAQLLRHEHAPLTLAQACSAVPASTPLFSSLLNYRHGKPRKKTGGDEALKGIAARGGEERTNYPIGMSVNDHGDELSLSVKSDASVDPDRLCGYMQTALAQLVEALESDPARTLANVEVVPERERAQVLVEWNATEAAYAGARCVHELFEEQTARVPESPALEFEGERLSYGELNARANRLARHLQALGVQGQTRVGVLMERSLEFVVGVLGVLKAGGVYVPLDPAYPQERLAYVVEDSAPVLLLTHGAAGAEVREAFARSGVPMIDVVTDAGRWSDQSASNLDAAAASDLAYVIYTSGSTGAPKGVMVSHEQLCSRLLGVQLDLDFGPSDVVTSLASPAFDIAMFELLMPLVSGGCSLLLGSAQVKDIEQLRARTQHATVFHAVPTLMEAWLDSLGASEYGSLHTILVGGEAVPERLLGKLTARFPQARVFEFYGPTEAVIISTRYRADGAALEGVTHCIGRPFANTRTYILDQRLQPAPIGVGGELYIGGAQIARGYLNRADLTAERFIASPFVDGDRLYKTGDLARYLPDGNIEFLGRNDFQVKIRGFRIELGEIEARLASYPGVREAVVVALEDRAGEKRLVAYYTTLGVSGASDAPDALGAEVLRSHVAATLPEYMIPAAYVHLDALPLTAHGKLDRRALPAPDDSAYASRAYEAPVGDVELTLAAVWRELLKVERVGRNDNFFELGGHSLLVVAALERLRQVGLHVDAAAFFASSTLAALASEARDESFEVAIPPNAIPADCTTITPDMLPLVQLTAMEIAGIVAAVPGGAANVQDIYPLAPLQEGILFHHMLGGDGDPYLGRSTYRFDSRERLDAYLHALESIIARHDVLRTAVAWEGLPEPVQVVLRRAPLTVEEVSVDPTAGDVADQLAARFNPRRFRLDVRQAPIMRAYIARDGAGDAWSMVLLKHHLLGDHTTMELMQHEVEAHLLGRAAELPAPVPFRNFIAQARLGVSREEHELFFREMLSDVDEPTAPFGLVNVQGDGTGTRRTYQIIDAALAERLRNAARSIGVSTASICHVAWARVLASVSGRDDVVFGSVMFGRMQGGQGADRALGMFMNTLPVRLRIGERGVRESIEEAQLLLAQLLRHEHAPLALAQRCSSVPTSTPLFSSLLNYRHGKPRKKKDGDEAWKGIAARGGEERTNYPVTISVNDHGDELSLSAQTDASVDPDRLCGSMQTVLAQLVEALENEPARALARIEVLSDREREHVLVEWNATERPYPDVCVHELFEAQARTSPDATAVEDERAQLGYAELNERANRLARHLRARGVGPDVRVGVCMERSVEMAVALLAVFKAGGAYVPLDPAYPIERLAYVVEDSAPALVLTHEAVAAEVRETFVRSGAPAIDVVAGAARWAGESGEDLARNGLRPTHLAYVIYTSGSTGRPKGAMNEHRAVVNRLLWMQDAYELGADDAVLQKTPFSFDVSVWELFWPLLSGARLVMARPEGHKDPEYLARIVHERRITTMHFVPSMLGYFLEQDAAAQCASLVNVMCSGEALTKSLVERFYEALPLVQLSNLYGPTEAAVDVTAWLCPRENVPANVPIGRPIANTRMYILDNRREPAPVGVAGELYIGGVQVGRGYMNRPDLTAERFIANPFVAGDRLYKTGDLARFLPDGTIEYLGRNDFQVKIRGFRIELGEIEACLATYPGVREAVVTAPEDAVGEKRLVAYYTAPEEIGAQALRDHLLAALPDYMVPALYVPLESLPLTSSGKLDRNALPAPDGAGYASRAYEAPAGEIEIALAAIWSELLKVERVGRNDNFFELGGHSLLAMRVLSRVRQAFALEARLSDVFSHPTLGGFAHALATSTRRALPPLLPVDRSERIPLSFSQERLWFSVQLDPATSRAYHIPFGLPMKGELDVSALRRALNEIVARHESLRTTFAEVDGEAVQRIAAPDAGFELVEHDLRGAPDAAAELQRLSARERQTPFDLQTGPLIRGRLITTEDDEHLLAVTAHHIVSDGWSTGVFMRELNALYAAYRAGRPSPLPPLAIQFADYAVWQRRWLADHMLQDQVAYWQRTLAGVPALLELPSDRPRPAVSDHRGASLGFELDAETTARVKTLTRRHGSTLFITLLTAWGALLARLSGQNDVVVGTPVANRLRPELEPLIGFFVNTLALRLDYSGSRTVSETLNHVKERVIAGQDNQDIPFDQVVEVVNPARSLSYNALFQTMFVWNNAERGERTLEGLEARTPTSGPASAASSQVDLTLELAERGDRIAGTLVYATALFDRETIERYCGYLQRILVAMVEDES